MSKAKVKLWSERSKVMTCEDAKDRKGEYLGIEFTAKPKHPYTATYKNCSGLVVGNAIWDNEKRVFKTQYSINLYPPNCVDPAKALRYREWDLALAIATAATHLKQMGDAYEKSMS